MVGLTPHSGSVQKYRPYGLKKWERSDPMSEGKYKLIYDKFMEPDTMKIKEGVSLIGLKIEMRKVLMVASALWKQNGQELVITAGTDGVHSPSSMHYYGYALDFRSRYFTEEQKKEIVQSLRILLGDLYDVVEHSTHIHVEYDKSKIMD